MEITDSVSCGKYRTKPSFTARSSALSALPSTATGVAGTAGLTGSAGVAGSAGLAGAAGVVSVEFVPVGAVAVAALVDSSLFLQAPNVNITAGMNTQNNRVFIEA